jgi:hypothetical protein
MELACMTSGPSTPVSEGKEPLTGFEVFDAGTFVILRVMANLTKAVMWVAVEGGDQKTKALGSNAGTEDTLSSGCLEGAADIIGKEKIGSKYVQRLIY